MPLPTSASARAAAVLLPLFVLFVTPSPVRALEPADSHEYGARIQVTHSSSTTTTTLADDCGDGAIDQGEDCDEGSGNSDASGAYCSTNCVATACAAPVGKTADAILTSDALFTLRASVKLETCSPYVCDVDGSGTVNTSDALAILWAAVHLPASLLCPLPGAGSITCMGQNFASLGDVFAALAGDYDVALDGGIGGIYDSYASATAITMRILENFLGYAFVSTATDGSTSYGAAYLNGTAGYSWEDLAHEVNVYFGPEAGTTKILQCDKTNGQLTFVVSVATGGPNFARVVTTP